MEFAVTLTIMGIMAGAIYALIALGFVIIYKTSKVFNFAGGEFLLIGAFVAWSCLEQFNLGWGISFVLTLLASAALGWVTNRLLIRPMTGQPIISIIMMTLGLSALLVGLSGYIWPTGYLAYPDLPIAGVITVLGVPLAIQQLLFFGIALGLFFAFAAFFQRTNAGLAMRAAAEDVSAAQSVGISVNYVSSLSWIIAALVLGTSGILLGSIVGVQGGLGALGLKALPVVILGGLDSIAGAIVAGMIIGVVENLAAGYLDPIVGGGMKEVIPYIIMIIVLLVRPYGLFGLKRIERL